jgi:hypothetical protein
MFDPKKAAFLLIAAVIGVQLLVVVASAASCIYIGIDGTPMPEACSDGRFGEMLTAALAVGIALYGASKDD